MVNTASFAPEPEPFTGRESGPPGPSDAGSSPAATGRALLAWADRVAEQGGTVAAHRLRLAARVLFELPPAASGDGGRPARRNGLHAVGPAPSVPSPVRTARAQVLESLTASERKVAEAVASGHSNKQVAIRLSMSPRTAEIHLTRIYAKLGLRGRVDLTRLMLALDDRLPATGEAQRGGA